MCDGILGADNQEYIMNTRWQENSFRDQDDHKQLRSIDLLTGYLNPSDNDLLFSEITTAKETPTALNGVTTNKTFKR